jgi:4-diphosphocytidyl-2-C-methyl-D-erythritol kinase
MPDSIASRSLPSIVIARAPAKLNLFLELLRKREDGYHEIETVMVPINRYDTLAIRTRAQSGIRIQTDWWPSPAYWATALGKAKASELLAIPNDERNLIHRAVTATAALSDSRLGFDVQVRKRIPAGAGMGGASSDAAATIRAVAALTGISPDDDRLPQVAAAIGSDVPFFLGNARLPRIEKAGMAADRRASEHSLLGGPSCIHATKAMLACGRGEKLSTLPLSKPLRFIVAFPATALSTALVYRSSEIPAIPESSLSLIDAMKEGRMDKMGSAMMNRLSEPAIKLSPLVKDLLEQMWQAGLPRCQLTGSGSACFSLLDDASDCGTLMKRLNTTLNAQQFPAVVFAARSISIPQRLCVPTNLQTSL